MRQHRLNPIDGGRLAPSADEVRSNGSSVVPPWRGFRHRGVAITHDGMYADRM